MWVRKVECPTNSIVVVNACLKSNFLLCKKNVSLPIGWYGCVCICMIWQTNIGCEKDSIAFQTPPTRYMTKDVVIPLRTRQVFWQTLFTIHIRKSLSISRLMWVCTFGSYFMQSFRESNRCLGKFAAVIAKKNNRHSTQEICCSIEY